jgi:hypothetical protein
MMEHSPVTQPLKPAGYCCLKPNPTLEVNERAWTRATTMLYVEHPWGTGFSYGRPEPANEYEASGDLHAFVRNFFAVFPDLSSSRLYVFGESYAGMFVPSILHYFHRENLKKDRPAINIAGGAIVSSCSGSVGNTCIPFQYSRPHTPYRSTRRASKGQRVDGPRHPRTGHHRLLVVARIDR